MQTLEEHDYIDYKLWRRLNVRHGGGRFLTICITIRISSYMGKEG